MDAAIRLHPGPGVWKDLGKLTAVAVKAALSDPCTYQDDNGLFLKIGKTASASLLLRLQQDGKRRDIGVGSAKLVTLAEAWEKANELHKSIQVNKPDVLKATAKVAFRETAT